MSHLISAPMPNMKPRGQLMIELNQKGLIQTLYMNISKVIMQ